MDTRMPETTVTEIPTFLKAIHLFALVAFFAGTFHIVRLFVAHREAMAKTEPDRTILLTQFSSLERSALFLLIWPALALFMTLGAWILWQRMDLLKRPFMHVFLGYLAVLLVYHFVVHRLYYRLKRGDVKWSAFQLRVWAQGATLFLFALIVLVLFRERTTWLWGSFGLLVVGATVMFIFASLRRRVVKPTDAEPRNHSA